VERFHGNGKKNAIREERATGREGLFAKRERTEGKYGALYRKKKEKKKKKSEREREGGGGKRARGRERRKKRHEAKARR